LKPLSIAMSQTTTITGRLQVQGLGPFGESLQLTLMK
jgi:hypothetical protein